MAPLPAPLAPPNVVKPAGAAPARGFVQADAPKAPVGRDYKVTVWRGPGDSEDDFADVLQPLRVYPGVRVFPRGACGAVVYVPGNLWGVVRLELRALARFSASVEVPKPHVEGDPWRFVERAIATGELRAQVDGKPLAEWVRRFQAHFVRWSLVADGGFAIHPPGAGKTASAIVATAAQAQCYDTRRATAPWSGTPVVVVTRAVVRPQWGREIQRLTTWDPWVSDPDAAARKAWEPLPDYLLRCWSERRRPVIVGSWEDVTPWAFGKARTRKAAGDDAGAVEDATTGDDATGDTAAVATGTSATPSLHDHLQGVPFLLVMDEIHNAKSAQRRSVSVDADGEETYTRRENRAGGVELLSSWALSRLALTGTPVPDRVRDLYAIHTLVEPRGWGPRWTAKDRSKAGFGQRYCEARPGAYGGMDDKGASHLDELARRRACVCHVVTKEEARAELPKLTREVYRVGVAGLGRASAESTADLRRITKEVGNRRESDARIEAELAVAASRKRPEVLARIVEAWDAGQKVTVFTGRRADVADLGESVRRVLRTKGVDEAALSAVRVTHGSDPATVRAQIALDYYQAAGPAVLVSTGASLGEGVNLHSTDLAIFAQIPYTPREVEQWEGRFVRLGQDRPVTLLYLLATGSIDERVAWILADKLPAVESQVPGEATTALAAAIKGTDDPTRTLASVLQSVAEAVAAGVELDPDDRD